MVVFLIRLAGGILGLLVTHILLFGRILGGSGESVLAGGMFFWTGGWAIVLLCDTAGFVVGFLAVIPIVNAVGSWIWRTAQRRQHHKRKDR